MSSHVIPCRLCRWRVWGWYQVNDSFSNIWKSRSFSMFFTDLLEVVFFSRRKLRFGRPLESVKTVAAVTWQTCKQLKVAHFCRPFWLNGKKQKHPGVWFGFFLFFFVGLFFQCIRKKGETSWLLQHLPLFLRILRADVELCSFSKVRSLILRVGSWEELLVSSNMSKSVGSEGFFWTWRPRFPPPFNPEARLARKWEQTLNQRERFGRRARLIGLPLWFRIRASREWKLFD